MKNQSAALVLEASRNHSLGFSNTENTYKTAKHTKPTKIKLRV